LDLAVRQAVALTIGMMPVVNINHIGSLVRRGECPSGVPPGGPNDICVQVAGSLASPVAPVFKWPHEGGGSPATTSYNLPYLAHGISSHRSWKSTRRIEVANS